MQFRNKHVLNAVIGVEMDMDAKVVRLRQEIKLLTRFWLIVMLVLVRLSGDQFQNG